MQPLAASCSHSSGRKWPQLAATGRWGKWPQVAASGRKWPQVAASGRKWPQVAAWTANTSSNGPTLENLKKMLFSRTACVKFSVKREVRVETKGKKYKEITNRREELKRKDGRNEMDKVKGKEELNEQDRRVDTKAQTQRIERKS